VLIFCFDVWKQAKTKQYEVNAGQTSLALTDLYPGTQYAIIVEGRRGDYYEVVHEQVVTTGICSCCSTHLLFE